MIFGAVKKKKKIKIKKDKKAIRGKKTMSRL